MPRHHLLLLLAAVLMIGLVFSGPKLLAPESQSLGWVALPISAAVALIVFAATRWGSWRRSGGWVALAIVGQAMALQMIDAGRRLHYQHYRLYPRVLGPEEWLLLLGILVQTAMVLGAYRGRLGPVVKGFAGSGRRWRLAAMAVAFCVTSAALSAQWVVYLGELAVATMIQLLNLLTVLLVVRDAPAGSLSSLGRRLGLAPPIEGHGARPQAIPRLAWLVAAWVSALAALLALFVYQGHPHVPDEVAYFLQARYFAAGKLFLDAPPVPEAFDVYCMFHSGERWFSVFPPGWPALLAAGFWIGAPWLVNPILGGVNVLLTYALVRDVWGERTARIVILLIAASPWFVFMAMNLMSHTFALTGALLAFWALLRCRRTRKARWAAVSGMALGVLALTRPYDAVPTALLLGLAAVWPSGRRVPLRSVLVLLLAAAAITSLLLAYNWKLTGSPTTLPADSYYDEVFGPGRYGLGFGSERGLGWAIDAYVGHSPFEASVNTALNLFSVNIELHGWGAGSLLLILVLLASRRLSARDSFLLISIGAVVLGYGLYWYHGGPDFGARYWFLIIVPCLVLSVRGAQELVSVLRAAKVSEAAGRVALALIVLCFFSLVDYFPWRALDKYWHYLDMSPDLRNEVAGSGARGALVLIEGDAHPDYASAAAWNPLDWSSAETIYARDVGATNERLLSTYPARELWRVQGPSMTGGGYRIVGRKRERRRGIADQPSVP